jgi:hypothetical protein
MKTIGILPASGAASRINGIPKFCLPINDSATLIEWHVKQLESCVDEIRIVSREMWAPFIPTDNALVKLTVKEPSTMTDAVCSVMDDISEGTTYIIGMPDTYINTSSSSIYGGLSKDVKHVKLLALPMSQKLKGRVGQIDIDRNGFVRNVEDKNPRCTYDFMWAAFSICGTGLDPKFSTPSTQFNTWIKEGTEIQSSILSGEYIDAGSFEGLVHLYGVLGHEESK